MRTKTILATVLGLALAGLPAMAGAMPHESIRPPLYVPLYHTENIAKVTIEQARLMMTETPVIVQGNLVQRVGRDLYVFEDDSSSILVTIPEDVLLGEGYTRGAHVELHGELSKSPMSVKIKVAKMVKVD